MNEEKDPRIVIALGGNALGDTAEDQQKKIEAAAPALVGLIRRGYEIIVTHVNGPQVGMINNAFAYGSKQEPSIPPMELAECTAMSQGYIGYHLQKGIRRELRELEMPWHIATVVTQVVVDENDPAFHHPQKPIGPYYTKEEAEELQGKHPDHVYADDAGRGYRRMVPSPKPVTIVEKESIMNLLNHEFVVIACGGGGIPVVKEGCCGYRGVPAVVDKDFAAAKLAELVEAKYLFILTAVDKVSINFGKPDEQPFDEMTTEQAEAYIAQGQFAPGSMRPKVEAAVSFAKSGPGRVAVIAALDKAAEAVDGSAGTRIYEKLLH